MATNQGVKIAAFVMAFSLAANLVGAMGAGQVIGVDRDPGIGGQDIAEQTTPPEAQGGFFSEVASLLGVVINAVKTVLTLGGVLTGVEQALTQFDAPAELALTVQLVVNVAFAVGAAAFMRGLRDL